MNTAAETTPSQSTQHRSSVWWSLLYVSIAWGLALVVFATENTGSSVELGVTTIDTGIWMSLVVVLPAVLLVGFAVLSFIDAKRLVSTPATILALIPWALVSLIALLAIGFATDESPADIPSGTLADRVHAWGWLTFSFAFPGMIYFCLSRVSRLASSPLRRWALGWATAAIPTIALGVLAAYIKFG